jgi:hypothetical protein
MIGRRESRLFGSLVAVLVLGGTGIASCGAGRHSPRVAGGGAIHRAQKLDCALRAPRAESCLGDPSSTCRADSDCTAKPGGWCEGPPPMLSGPCACSYGCVRDSDCVSGRICECDEVGGRCIPAACTSDADCRGGLCLKSRSSDCYGSDLEFYACETAGDECLWHDDCAAGDACVLARCGRTCQKMTCI